MDKTSVYELIGAICVACGVLAQYLILDRIQAISEGMVSIGLICSILAALVFYFSRHFVLIRSLLISISIGGFGMLLGVLIDGDSSYLHHAHHQSLGIDNFLSVIPTYMTGLMILFCLPSCVMFCGFSTLSRFENQFLHVAALAPMILGMVACMIFFAELMRGWLDSQFLGHYISMLIGMGLGYLIGLNLIKYCLCKVWLNERSA